MEPLTQEQVEFAARSVCRWIHHLESLEMKHDAVDASHSSLLRRLLEGKPLLEKPPPRSFSYPCYALAEGEEVEVVEVWEGESVSCPAGTVVVDQCGEWRWHEKGKVLQHVPTGDLYAYSERTAYPVWVRDGRPEDHPYTGKFLQKLPAAEVA